MALYPPTLPTPISSLTLPNGALHSRISRTQNVGFLLEPRERMLTEQVISHPTSATKASLPISTCVASLLHSRNIMMICIIVPLPVRNLWRITPPALRRHIGSLPAFGCIARYRLRLRWCARASACGKSYENGYKSIYMSGVMLAKILVYF